MLRFYSINVFKESQKSKFNHVHCCWMNPATFNTRKVVGYLQQHLIFRRVGTDAKSGFKLRHVCPPVRMEQLGSHWADFHDIWYLSIFRKFVKIIQVSLKSDKNKGYFTWRPIYIFDLAHFFLEWEMFRTRVVENVETHISGSVTFVFFRNLCRLWCNVEKVVQLGRPQMTMWRLCLASWIPKATNTHLEYVIPIAVPLQQCLHERFSVLRYAYIGCLVMMC
jgi:hypothetical protein